MHESIEEMRVFSQLTQGFHVIEAANEKFGVIGGLVLPYNLAVVFILYTVTGSSTYQTLITQQQLDTMSTLNTHDKNMPLSTDKNTLIWYISMKVRDILITCDSSWF